MKLSTSADFDSSMVYYMRHTELLHDVYKDLAERLDKEVVALGGNSTGNSDFDNLTAVGDTANIWKDATSMVFSPDEKPTVAVLRTSDTLSIRVLVPS